MGIDLERLRKEKRKWRKDEARGQTPCRPIMFSRTTSWTRTVTEMYEELTAKLRDHNACISIKTLDEAADAIEELANKLCDWCGVCPKKDVDRGIAKSCGLMLQSQKFTLSHRRRKHNALHAETNGARD